MKSIARSMVGAMVLVLVILGITVAYAAQTLLEPTTSAVASSSFKITNNGRATIVIYAASGHTASEYSDVQISHDGCTTFADLYVDGSQIRLSSTNTAQTVHGPGCFRVDKEATTNATGVYLSTEGSL